MDEQLELNTEPQEVIESTPAAVEYTDSEKRAMEQGWVPEDQWNGSGRWRSAEDFLDRGELFSKIDEVKRRAERAERTLDDLKKHHQKVRETEFKRAITYLRAQKAEAVEAGDGERVVEIDERIDEAKAEFTEQQESAKQDVQTPEPNPLFTSWMNRNGWYSADKVMKGFADEVAERLVVAGVRDHTEILREVERRVKREYPEKFENPNRSKASAVESSGAKGGDSRKDSFQLTPEETQVMNRLVKANVMTKEEYIAEIKSISKGA